MSLATSVFITSAFCLPTARTSSWDTSTSFARRMGLPASYAAIHLSATTQHHDGPHTHLSFYLLTDARVLRDDDLVRDEAEHGYV